jgi:imidazole glycerol phosphate synthase glutamine amidotransferase subunit
MDALIVRTGIANLASVEAGLRRAGADCVIADDPGRVAAAERVVLPGVGTMKAAMDGLHAQGLVDVLRDRVRAGRPTLAICLGLQLLFETSEESPGTKGLGVLPGHVSRFPTSVRTPQMGWNRVEPEPGAVYLEPGFAYFANSYRVETLPPPWSGAYVDYGGRSVAALERGAVLACQFHPELSGAWGLALLRRWLVQAAVPC